jgi:hypothetical protein
MKLLVIWNWFDLIWFDLILKHVILGFHLCCSAIYHRMRHKKPTISNCQWYNIVYSVVICACVCFASSNSYRWLQLYIYVHDNQFIHSYILNSTIFVCMCAYACTYIRVYDDVTHVCMYVCMTSAVYAVTGQEPWLPWPPHAISCPLCSMIGLGLVLTYNGRCALEAWCVMRVKRTWQTEPTSQPNRGTCTVSSLVWSSGRQPVKPTLRYRLQPSASVGPSVRQICRPTNRGEIHHKKQRITTKLLRF